jgi:hypothetical protein
MAKAYDDRGIENEVRVAQIDRAGARILDEVAAES